MVLCGAISQYNKDKPDMIPNPLSANAHAATFDRRTHSLPTPPRTIRRCLPSRSLSAPLLYSASLFLRSGMTMIYKSLSVRGLAVNNFVDRFDHFYAEVTPLVQQGAVKFDETV